MKMLKQLDLRPVSLLKYLGLIALGLVIIMLIAQIAGMATGGLLNSNKMGFGTSPSFGGMDMGMVADEAYYDADVASMRGMPSPMPPMQTYVPGDNAEEYEVVEHNGTIKTRHLEETCGKIAALKSRPDVIFEWTNEGDTACDYRFKVEIESAAEILEFIEGLNPETLSANIQTIKGQIDSYTNEVEVLTQKRQSIDETLEAAIAAYDDVTALATRGNDVESLSKIIDSRLTLIERLTQERININEQLARYERAKADQLDRLSYTHFNISVYEFKYVDFEAMKDSWQRELQEFVANVNAILQGLTIGLIAAALFMVQVLIYLFLLLFVAKYTWKTAKHLWKM